MAGFALNLDLTLYFDDLRRYACIYVDSTKCKEVGDVENHIKAVFKLEDNICLTNKKFLIPRCESIGILQQYDTLKVQKCDFYDYQIHKNKKSNQSCDQSALNLIQSDRTIDLSCRPKQRFKINICQNHCVLEAPLTPFESNQIEYYPQQLVLSNERLLDSDSNAQTKCKTKHKKRKHDCLNGELEKNNDENQKILDMSVKKPKKNKNDATIVDETFQDNVDSPIYCTTQVEFDTKKVKKSKKKKKLLQDEEIYEEHSKKHKKQKNIVNEEFNYGLAKDLSFSAGNNCEEDRKKSNSERKSIQSNDDREHINKTSSKSNNDHITLKTPIAEITDIKDDVNVGFKISKKRIEDYQRTLQEKVDKLLLIQKNSENSHMGLEEAPVDLLSTSKVINSSPPTNQDNNESMKMNGEQFHTENVNLDSSQVSNETGFKRKRIRKHNKKKKRRDKLELLYAVGPVLQRVTTPSEVKSSPSSDLIKHIYFNDEDFIEEMKIPTTPSSQTVLQDQSDNKIQNPSKDIAGPNLSGALENEAKTWQEEFLKRTTHTLQPLIFHRSAPSPAISDKNDSPCKSDTSSTLLPKIVVITGNECSKEVEDAKEHQFVSKSFTISNGEQIGSSNLELDLQVNSKSRSNCSSFKTNQIDFKNVVLTDYPVIEKVVAEDLILFKVVTLSDKCEPKCSDPILARVKNAARFPDNISLQIMEGDVDSINIDKEEGSDIELCWSDLVEPRLFYP